MALRKDKVAAALREMKGLCTNADEPASLPNAIGQLADILGELFDDISIDPLPPIDTGIDGLPDDVPFDFPLGGGDVPPFDPGGGFEGSPPGGGDGFGEDGGEGDEEGGQFDPRCVDEGSKHVTFLAKTIEEIPASVNGIPGKGQVQPERIFLDNPKQFAECEKECNDTYKEDLSDFQQNLWHARHRGELDAGDGSPIFGTADEAVKHWQKRLTELSGEYHECVDACDAEPIEPEDDGPLLIVQNISCAVIEKDTQVVVSGRVNECVYRDAEGYFLDSTPNPGTEDLYVMVEACGCD